MQARPLPNLTGIRAVAAYLVLVAHTGDVAFLYSGVSLLHDYMSRLAYVGMSLFFVLSGFVIHYNYSSTFSNINYWSAVRGFYIARFARIYPLYSVFFLVSISYIPSSKFQHKPIEMISFMTLTQSWFNYQSITFLPAWSMSTEWFFYLAYVVLVPVVLLVKGVRNAMIFAMCGAVLLTGLVVTAFLAQSWVLWALTSIMPVVPESDLWSWFQYFSPCLRVAEFLMGVLSAHLFMSVSARPVTVCEGKAGQMILWISLGAIMFLGGFSRFPPMSTWPLLQFLTINFGWAPPVACILFCTSRYDSAVARALSTPLAVNAGELSYSVYILQFWIFTMLTGFVSPAASPLAYFNSAIKFVLIIALTTVMAYGSFHLIEKPARRWLRAVLAPRRSPVP